uniref:NADH dehydrogenase subunit 2 n=1 Tax=Amblyomma parvum TaxID=251391 RepID=UPI002E76ABDB|nr:NADH dehydrogenase subunit 2 [Amblyomma parvum]WQF69056.1 NADH dehydrogenase subunit 2 [Amblyomma parvum]
MNFKNLMKWMILMTIMISFSSNSWFIFWLMMEMNLLFFVPIMNFKNKIDSNLMITYFIIQCFSSTLFFMSAMNFIYSKMHIFMLIINISMMIKLALIPFHFWLSSISEMIEFQTLFFILTFQKMIPMIILTHFKTSILIFFISISSMIASLLALNSKSFKKILIFSSISHQGWVISMIIAESNFWVSYMIIYSFLILKISNMCLKFKLNYVSIFFAKNKFTSKKMSIIFLMLSLGGMPPFLGFFMKLISIIILIQKMNFLLIILIISSMVNIFFYMQMISPILFNNFFTIKNFNKSLFFNNLFMNMNLILSIFMLNMMIS